MFLVLNQFKTICLLLLLITFTQCEGSTYGTFFPSVPKEINKTTFPLNLRFAAKSDVILLKCPGSEYKHQNTMDNFKENKLLVKSGLMYSDTRDLFNWIISVYNASGPQLINCGDIGIKRNDGSHKHYDWMLNFNWQPGPNPYVKAKREKIINQLPITSKCGNDQKKILKFTRDKEGKLFELILVNEELKASDDLPHVNKLYYLFTIPEDTYKKEIEEPCMIFRAVNDRPLMVINGYNSTQKSLNNIDINVIKFDYLETSLEIQLLLTDQPKLKDFYKNEEILISKVIFTKDGAKEVPNSNKTTKGKFSLNGYELLKFSYDCPSTEDDHKITKIFYFAPPQENFKFPLEYILYASNETVVRPNCSINRFSFGYLYSVDYINKKIVNLTELNANGVENNGLYRSGAFVFTTDVTNFNTTLKCLYKTPNGEVALIHSFLHNDKASFGIDENGKRYLNVDEDKVTINKIQKSRFEKFKETFGTTGAISIIVGSVIIGILIFVGISVLIFLKAIKLHIRRKKLASKYPNIFALWKELSNANLEEYCKIVQSKKYIPDILKKQSVLKKIEGDEEVEFNTSTLFDSSLVKCFKSIFGEIRAHYINDVSPERKYIISDGPAPESVKYFWELFYKEDVAVVISMIYQDSDEDPETKNKLLYWPEKNQTYGNVTVKCLEELPTSLQNVKVLKFSMTMKEEKSKDLILYHVMNWKEHTIPHLDLHFINLHSEVSECAGNRNVLVHASRSAGSRVFMFTYFCCILEAIKADTSVYNPMEIIKEVREKRYGGNISSIEYAYLLKALVTYFFDNMMLIDKNNERMMFTNEYDRYLYKLDARKGSMDRRFKLFLQFINILDEGKLDELCVQFNYIGMMRKDALIQNCQRYYTAKGSLPKRNRYNDIECLDKTSVNVNGYDINNVLGYIHANQMVYKYGDGKERKIIMCQAPIQTTVDDMYDMIFRYKIGIIVILVNVKEITVQNKCFPYFPTDAKEMKGGKYTVMYIDKKVDDLNHIIEYDFTIHNDKNVTNNFKILHYTNWPDKSIPNESKTIHELYRRIINLYNDRHVAIHCSAGVGRTGTLALAIYMIDMINSCKAFDPIKFLDTLRSYRYKAVQNKSQFIFSLSIVYEHFRNKIDEMDPEAYNNFTTMSKNIFRQSEEYKG
ncbi:Protein-tyrosine phosphatase, receptor/non-receptor type domain and Protein-tyrosine/Dual specificity phosphatase domain and Protein-tyrosine phosphatase, catalytic domain-containing protein [Strongyloides ratti]|uniref:Protein-tyrosine phosphatase, receptor/non-receptor type domain and Protein-tyrosine/Dual specificity phosphatase domain and Protein-tyrosine phosphatase, catalytic domain-containing protein n=1 Tax=Strongyloides ratti TaxID=34506 RepID=A0A090L9J4_STRRB|nr:Protein-tyrosine phosphatase, receptor/non-receptor type domain and Protein-tyrosine/Dual specificity phosphatase domain and Protein-tyrosine phosphatase, catalytic domain-containing protein [Strongyloides ratti]CEF66422.1 Protein-tyrosine phosphatase, receptor/non-receptor type domain and Protein-tyrosine/Dual specificity phosphatase domain and Protein-tyrosine phosphatase, catalytic domain-containing protein [Strongyloides ratti]